MESLEQRGFKCWIAPRDVRGGRAYGDKIIRGIEISRCLILVLSAAGNELPFVAREVERAVSKRKAVFPIRIENVLPAPGLELFVSSTHWIDAWSGKLALKIDELAALIAEEDGGKRRPPRALAQDQSRWRGLLSRRALAVLLAVLGGWSAYRGGGQPVERATSTAASAAVDAPAAAPLETKTNETQVATLVPPAPVAPPPPQYKPGDTFRDWDNCPEMVVVPAGTFTMGNPNDSAQRQVTIPNAFAIGKFEVTKDQFDAFVKESGYDVGSSCETFEADFVQQRPGRSFRNPGFSQSGSEPVTCVSWDDAQAYAAWLSRKT